MRSATLTTAGIAASSLTTSYAFVRPSHKIRQLLPQCQPRNNLLLAKSILRIHSSFLSADADDDDDDDQTIVPSQELQQTQQSQRHPHSLLWSNTLETSPNSYLNHSVDLAIRSPSQGGTGIVATDDIPANTVIMCLPLEEVSMIDASSILDSYNEEDDGDDAVLTLLKEMWNEDLSATTTTIQNSDEGKRLAVLAGIIAHLQLTRFREKAISQTCTSIEASYSLEQSRGLGLFLDAMPLLPQHNADNHRQQHPFPTHFLYWTDDEVEILLQGTMGQTKAREVRAGIGLVVRKWSSAFIKEHYYSDAVTQAQILNAILSAFTAVLSRSFGDSAGRDLSGKGRMLVPLVDMLNHDGEDPNVRWMWHVGEGDDNKVRDGSGNIVVTTLRHVLRGEELVKCYGWRPAWDIASSYGFVPELKRERWECAVIPLFPTVLDLDNSPSLDLLLETNYGPLVKAVVAALDVSKGNKETFMELEEDRPKQLDRIDVVSLFRPPPASTAGEFPFTRRQPCVIVGTKIQSSPSEANDHYHQNAVERILPAFRAAASALSQLKQNHSFEAETAITLDNPSDLDSLAKELIEEGIRDRIKNLVEYGTAAQAWLATQCTTKGIDDENRDYLQRRASLAREVREAELIVLRTLQQTILKWETAQRIEKPTLHEVKVHAAGKK